MDEKTQAIFDIVSKPLVNIPPESTVSGRFGILVWNFAFGQFRIQITDSKRHDRFAEPGHGAIIRAL